MTEIALDGFPSTFRWSTEPAAWRLTGDRLEVSAGPETDMFADPVGGGPAVVTAPRLMAHLDGDLQLRARVRVGFQATYDAGVLLVWADETHWAKLCFEQSPQGGFTIVTVVTRGRSDDANGFTVDGPEVWLRVSRLSDAFAFHASTDGTFWRLVRYFTLGSVDRVAYGFEAQSPVGAGCAVSFRDISWRAERLAELRDGS